MLNRVGQRLGNYHLMRLLGQGGFAEVYLGRHRHLGTEAAIKVLQTQLESAEIDQFRDEARLVACLIHPHIVRVLDFGVDLTLPFLVMDYAPGGSLRQRYPKGSRLPLSTVLSYVQQIAPALQYAHEHKLIHRDIKPGNLLVGRADEILLSDFGIALALPTSRYESTHDIVGTLAYAAPEQLQGKPRPASDQYALGIMVYEWFCGERPFHGSPVELIGQHTLTPPPPLHQRIPHIPSSVETVVLKALKKEPQERFASVQVFAKALEQALVDFSGPRESIISTELSIPAKPLPPSKVVASLVNQPISVTPPVSRSGQPSLEAETFVPRPLLPEKRGISRRAILVGLAGLTVVGTTAGLLLQRLFQQSSIHVSSTSPLSIPSTPALLPRSWSQVMAVGYNQNGNMQLFARSTDSNYWISTQSSDGSWSSWTMVANPASFKGHLVVASNPDGREELFGLGFGNNIYYSLQSAPNSTTWSSWQPIRSGYVFSGSPIVGHNQDGSLQLFARGSDPNYWINTQSTAGSWSTWAYVSSAAKFNGDPVVISNSDGQEELFGLGVGNNIYYSLQAASNSSIWSNWQPIHRIKS